MEGRKTAVIIGIVLLIAVGAFIIYKVFFRPSVDLKAMTYYDVVYVGKLDTKENVLGDLMQHVWDLKHWNPNTQVWEEFSYFVPNARYLVCFKIATTLDNFKFYFSVG